MFHLQARTVREIIDGVPMNGSVFSAFAAHDLSSASPRVHVALGQNKLGIVKVFNNYHIYKK